MVSIVLLFKNCGHSKIIKEVAISHMLRNLFVIQGLVIALVGTVTGVVVVVVVVMVVMVWPLLLGE